MDLYKRHRYEEAAGLLQSYLSSVKPGKEGAAYLSIGMVYLKNARLYQELYHTSLSVHLDYFKRLSAVKGESKSRFVKLYMGGVLLEAGKAHEAASCFKAFIAESDSKRIKPKYKAIANVGLGISWYLQGKKQKADNLWSGMKGSDPEILSELAAAYNELGLMDRNPAAMCEKSLALLKGAGKEPSMRVIKNIIGVYVRSGHIEKGFDLLKNVDTRMFSYEEASIKNKVIRFYDPALLNNLSILYGKASMVYLGKAAHYAKVQDAAQYYLGEAYAMCGDDNRSLELIDSFMSNAKTPKAYKDRAKVIQAEHLYQKGQEAEAINILKALSHETNDPSLLAEIIFACGRLKIETPEIVKKASALAEAGEGRIFSVLNFALGKYYLCRNDHEKALFYMEAGRDKSNKNRIEYNDPLMLVNLAEAYYRTKQFSEALEIYFEMSNHFPVVRQIQVAIQGVYSMEQKSAGDVKIF
jgi:tetratricopeptide (TPR) repeat protein